MQEIKLLKIHRRRMNALIEKKAKVGPHSNVEIGIEIEDIKEEMSTIEDNLRQRLQLLLEKAALYGFNCDPSVLIEIKDIEGYFE